MSDLLHIGVTPEEAFEIERALRAARAVRVRRNENLRQYAQQDPSVTAKVRERGTVQLAAIDSALARVQQARQAVIA